MTKVTIVKSQRNQDTFRRVELSEVAGAVASGRYRDEVKVLRHDLAISDFTHDDEGSFRNSKAAAQVPRVGFSAEFEKRGGRRVMLGYAGLVLLEVNNLRDLEEAEAVRAGAGRMPQTLMAFVGADGRSVKIVCRGELFLDARHEEDQLLPTDEEQVRTFNVNLYEQARMVYNGQLGVTVEKLPPTLERLCYLSYDPDMVYHPSAVPFYAVADRVADGVSTTTVHQSEEAGDVPGRNPVSSMHYIFEMNRRKAFEDTYDEPEETRAHATLIRLAEECLRTGVPMGVGAGLIKYSWIGRDHQLVDAVFNSVYTEKAVSEYRERKRLTVPLRNMSPEALLTMKINVFLKTHYDMRLNVMRGVAEFRELNDWGFEFRDLTDEARNSITMRALEQGIRCWDKDIRRFVNSEDIRRYDPMADFLEHLPRWDGRDRIGDLARRVPNTYEDWEPLFRLWMRSMVAMWLGKGQLTGNALVPLIIGRQGCGKSSFCRILLPRALRLYYNDRINFKNEADLNLGLSSFALINLDEFDKITQRQQIVLKYLVSTSDLKYRPPYGKAYTSHRRYASFIGTTNETMPLTDPTGSRRFVCVMADGDIDFQTPVEYAQVYAQLVQEVEQGERYWLNDEETQRLMQHNLQYQRMNGLGEMLMAVVAKPANDEEGRWMSLAEISALLKQTFKGYKEDKGTFERIGAQLSRPEYRFTTRRLSTGRQYLVKLLVQQG